MSVYKSNSPDNLSDAKKVRAYIMNVNKAVQNLFDSLTPDDNFTEEELNRYREVDTKISMLEMNVNGFRSFMADAEKGISSEISQQQNKISLKVRKGDLVNQLNVEPGSINIKGNRLEIKTKNLIVSESQMYAAGNITAQSGNIAGWKIESKNGHGYWRGDKNSRIDVDTITAESGSAGTIRATGAVALNATFMGNFDQIICDDKTKIDGDFTCSAMQESGQSELHCSILRLYTTYRDPYESIPSSPSYPDEDEWPYDYDWKTYYKKYNTNDLPYGGLVTDQVTCNTIYSKLANKIFSDRRLKMEIQDIDPEEGWELLNVLRPVRYRYRDMEESTYTGYIAQEVPKVYQAETPRGYLGLRYESIAATLDALLIKYSKKLREVENGRDNED